MANKRFLVGILVMVLVLAFGFSGCDNGTTGSDDPKTLVISGVPAEVYRYASDGGIILVLSAGTTLDQPLSSETGIVASAVLQSVDIKVAGSGPYTIAIPLYTTNEDRWTGNGTYDIYMDLLGSDVQYRARSVNFSSGTTTLPFSKVTKVESELKEPSIFSPPELIISDIPDTVYDEYALDGMKIGVFPIGTTTEQALSGTELVAGFDLQSGDIHHTIVIHLHTTNGDYWYGNGTYDVYVVLYGSETHYYRASSVNFSSGGATLPFSSASEVTP
jgi:hypothetical protein